MSSYPWTDARNANPYTDANTHPDVGVRPIDAGVEGTGYSPRPTASDADVTATTVSELLDAIEWVKTESGQVIWIEQGVYDFSDATSGLDLPAGATMAGNGATIRQATPKNGVFNLTNDDARLSGIRFEGPSIGRTQAAGTSCGLRIQASVTVDNCEVYGHHTAGIRVGSSGQQTAPSEPITPTVRNTVIRDNYHADDGAGIRVESGDPGIERCFLNNNTRGIAGSGAPWSSFQVRNIVHGPSSGGYQIGQEAPGGGRMQIETCELQLTQTDDGNPGRAYVQRGTPANNAAIETCWIWNPTPPNRSAPDAEGAAIIQTGHGSSGWAGVSFSGNSFGEQEPSDARVGIQPLSEASDTGFSGFEGQTDANGTVQTSVPSGEYAVTATHPDHDGTAEGTVTIDQSSGSVTISFGDGTNN